MKNPLDLIVAIVAAVLAIGLSLTFMFNKRPQAQLAPPNKINTADVSPPAGSVVFANSLGGGNSGGTGGPAGGAGGFGGGIPAPGGPGGLPPSGPAGLPPSGPGAGRNRG